MSLIPERRTPGAPNVAKCLNDAVEQGRLSRGQAEEALAHVKRLMDERPGTSEGAAAAAAAQALKDAAELRRAQTARQVLTADARTREAESHPDGFARGVAAIFGRDMMGRATYGNLEGRVRAIRGELHAMFSDGLEAYRTKTLGLTRDIVGLRSFVAEVFGEATGDGVARNAAMAWSKAAEYARVRFNAAGGSIRRLETWRLPQDWVPAKVKAAGRAEFERDLHDAFASGEVKIVDWETGDPVDAFRRSEIISQAWETISTDGLSKLVPGAQTRAKLANARQEKRAFEFATADAWLRFNEKYGSGEAGLFDLLVGHLDGMARDIAMLEKLGPNPEAMAALLIERAVKEKGTWGAEYRLRALYDHVTGAANSPVNEFAASFMRGVRAWLTASHLGSAFLSAPGDFATLRSTAAWNGLSATAVMGRYLSLMTPGSAADRRLAVRAGLIADAWSQRAHGMQRTMLEEVGSGLPSRMAEVVLRGSGLNAHTQMGKWAFGLEFLGALADRAGKELGGLEPEMQRSLARYGIDAATWDRIRQAPMLDEDGVRMLWPEKISGIDRQHQEAASRLLEMVNSEARFAIVEPDAVDRSLVLGNTRPGSAQGELIRSALLFKSFPISVATRHVMRGMGAIRSGDRGRYMVGMAVGMTVMGAFATQLRQVAIGRDPRDMTDWRFWPAAAIQGGALGIFGDFLNSATNRDGRNFAQSLLGGPMAGLVDDLATLTIGNLPAAADARKDTNFGRELGRFVQRYTPGSTLWYSRLALDRLMWDRLHELLDPDFTSHARNLHRRALRERNQQFFWGPGDDEPRRPPSLGAAIGQAAPR